MLVREDRGTLFEKGGKRCEDGKKGEGSVQVFDETKRNEQEGSAPQTLLFRHLVEKANEELSSVLLEVDSEMRGDL